MDTTDLQARIPQLSNLLPSQQEWLERLLFQLAFNDNRQIFIVGADGSGKSTLTMALAELFSEQYNIALLGSSTDESQVATQIMQQWFGREAEPLTPLLEQVDAITSQLPLLLIVDDAQRYSSELLQQLSKLPCLQFLFCTQAADSSGLVLTLNPITTADAQLLLQSEGLNSIELAGRVATAGGNIHLLTRQSTRITATTEAELKRPAWPISKVVYGIAALLIVLLVTLWPRQEEAKMPVRQPVELQPERPAATPAQVDINAEAETETEAEAEAEAETGALAVNLASDRDSDAVVEQAAGTTEDLPKTVRQAEPESLAKVDSLPQPEPQLNRTATATATASLYLQDEGRLLSMERHQVAVQLAVLSSEAALLRFKRAYPQLETLSYQRNWQGKMQLVLLLAPFEDAAAARAAMKQLPDALRATGLFIKALQAVQAEINARRVSQQSNNLE